MSMNNCCFVGRVSNDIEVKQTMNGVSVCSFGIAVTRNYKNAKGGYDTDFIPCTAWRDTAELIGRYFHKGSRIAVVCSADTRIVIDETSKRKYQCTSFTIQQVHFIDTKADGEKQTQSTKPAEGYYNPTGAGMEELAGDYELPF